MSRCLPVLIWVCFICIVFSVKVNVQAPSAPRSWIKAGVVKIQPWFVAFQGEKSKSIHQLRLRGGKRGRNSLVVGKQAHQKRQAAWTHFTNGETFGADAPAEKKEVSWKTAPGRQDSRPKSKDSARPDTSIDEPTHMQKLRAGSAGAAGKKPWAGTRRGGHDAVRNNKKHPGRSSCTRMCDEINRLGVDSVFELSCSYGPLLQRANVKCPNLTRYVGVDEDISLLNSTLARLSRPHPLKAAVLPRAKPLYAALLHGKFPTFVCGQSASV